MKNLGLLSLLLISLLACSPKTFKSQLNGSSLFSPDANGGFSTQPSQPEYYKFEALAWESRTSPDRAKWSQFVFKTVSTEMQDILSPSNIKDVDQFCPRYSSLSDRQRINFFGQLIAAMSKFESGWDPTSRMVETTMGTDPITGSQVASEGLLQLSYQDETSYNIDCGFDWSIDKQFSAKDPRKTILDPYKNLQCGLRILARQIRNRGSITLDSGVYWAVLKINGKYTKIPEIQAITKSLSFCK